MVTLIGANGAGKTTHVKALTGTHTTPARAGVRYNGADITASPRIVWSALGIAVGGRRPRRVCAPEVEENIDMGAYCRADKREILPINERVLRLFRGLPSATSRSRHSFGWRTANARDRRARS